MKLLHWNIHMWTDADGQDNVDRVIELLDDVQPDVISLVEVDEQWGQPAKLQRVADTLGYQWAFIPAFEYREKGGFGNALLSRTPMRSVQQWQLLPPMLYDGTEPTEPRAALLAEVDDKSGPLMVGSTHLPRHDEDLRKHASSRLLELLDRIVLPFALLGDFNQPAGAWLDKSHIVVPAPPQPTYPVGDANEAIDYCVGNTLTVESSAILETSASDHLPITLSLAS